ncbi:hypothetical protein [Bacillus sp. Marseille-Q1617]|uniref:hypothetical protein n=1 Tax=Bacillus sp. Marseille-Q1617 TaxID=2736887 RepID=UPI00158D0616|nr:hypothetical protein [Bacillus sp. Marseille-Q1617]
MNKQTTRAFSAGILFTTAIIFIYSFYFGSTSSRSLNSTPESHTIVKKSEIKAKENEISALKEQLETYETNTDKQNAPSQSEKYQLTLTIKPGMTPADIEEKLQEAKIISEEEQFVQFIVENEFADKIQVGEFLVHSEMTVEEIADLITK